MDFRTRLLRTLRAVAPILQEPGVLVAGSQVPNLLEPDVRSSLVVSQDVAIAVPIDRHAAVKMRLHEVRGLARISPVDEADEHELSALRGLLVKYVDPYEPVETVELPEPIHSDPANRIIIATALSLGATLVTKDRKIIAYPHVKTLRLAPSGA